MVRAIHRRGAEKGLEFNQADLGTARPKRNRNAVTKRDSQSGGKSPTRRVTINEDGYHRLLSAIYDLALAPTDWPTVLRLLADVLHSPHASSVITTPERDRPHPL